MFTGLIRHIGQLASRQQRGSGETIIIKADPELLKRAGQGASIAVMGVCLTAINRDEQTFSADLSQETLTKTTLGNLNIGTALNLEPALLLGEPIDGHQVTGHVDGVGTLLTRTENEGLWHFAFPYQLAPMLAPKGSIAIDGISLTIVEIKNQTLTISLIPQTVSSTTLKNLATGAKVNLEVDPIGRYVARHISLQTSNQKLQKFAKNGWK
ncbi:MAG: riboflavin synthase [Holophagaceae bacterium]|nr:riboflavin synthase [Holophagaceae bacterium]